MKRILIVLAALCLVAGCHHAEEKPRSSRDGQPTEKEQIQSEVREGGLRDPGGAKDVRQESEEQQKEQQDAVNDVDKQ